jgi:hypothetical protein
MSDQLMVQVLCPWRNCFWCPRHTRLLGSHSMSGCDDRKKNSCQCHEWNPSQPFYKERAADQEKCLQKLMKEAMWTYSTHLVTAKYNHHQWTFVYYTRAWSILLIAKIQNQIRDNSNKKALYYLTGRLLQTLIKFTTKIALSTKVTNIPKT